MIIQNWYEMEQSASKDPGDMANPVLHWDLTGVGKQIGYYIYIYKCIPMV